MDTFTIGGDLDGPPPRLRRHAHHRRRHLGRARGSATRRGAVLRRAVELGREPDRHRRLVRPGGERGADRRGAAPVPRRPGDRHQGRAPRAPARASGRRDGRPEHLQEACEGSLRRLRLDRIDALPAPLARPDGPARGLASARSSSCSDEGKIRHIGLSNVTVEQLARARAVADVGLGPEPLQPPRPRLGGRARRLRAATASASSRGSRSPPATSPRPGGPLDELARRHDATPCQVALAWLLPARR